MIWVSFGIIEIATIMGDPQHKQAVFAFGKPVLTFDKDEYGYTDEGPWIDVLHGLRRMLDERWGDSYRAAESAYPDECVPIRHREKVQ